MAWDLHIAWRNFVNDLHQEGAQAGLAVQEIQALLHSSFLRMEKLLAHTFHEVDLLRERSLDDEACLEIASEWAASLHLDLLEARLDRCRKLPEDWEHVVEELRITLEEQLYREEMARIRQELTLCVRDQAL